MDPEESFDAPSGLGPDKVESEAVIIPIQVKSEAVQPKEGTTPTLYPPQIFIAPKKSFLSRHPRAGKKRKLLATGGALMLVTALGFGVFQTVVGRSNKQAAAHTADTFIQAEFSADTEKALTFVDTDTVKEDNLKALGMLIKPALKSQPVRVGYDVQKQEGKHRAVFTYRFTMANPQKKSQEAEALPVYIVVLLQKDADNWQVKSQSMSAVDPKADIHSYSNERFEGS